MKKLNKIEYEDGQSFSDWLSNSLDDIEDTNFYSCGENSLTHTRDTISNVLQKYSQGTNLISYEFYSRNLKKKLNFFELHIYLCMLIKELKRYEQYSILLNEFNLIIEEEKDKLITELNETKNIFSEFSLDI